MNRREFVTSGIGAFFVVAAGLAFADTALPVRNPAEIWNLDELYKKPDTRIWEHAAHLQTRPILIRSEPWQGKPTWVFAYYGVPERASKEHPVPAIVLANGGGGTAYPAWVATWVQRGYAAICVDTCGSLPVRQADNKWLKNPEGGPVGWGRLDIVDEPEREQWMYHAVAAVVRSHSFLRSLPEVDASCVGITGISWGGVLTCLSAAADSRFAYAIPVYGCAFNCTPGEGIMAKDENAGRPDASEKWFRLWDPAGYLPFAKCPFLWVDGTNDRAFRLDNVRRSADLKPGANAFATITRMVHSHGPCGENQPEIFAFADHYANGGKDVVRVERAGTEDGVFTVAFAANGHKVVRAELVYTADGEDVAWPGRYWHTLAVDRFDPEAGAVSVHVPAEAKMYHLNLVDYNGLVSSTPLQLAR